MRMSATARRTSGFTLIELMITVAIIAIIAGIAYPSYQNYVVRTNRAAAKACLSQYAQFMERFYTTNLTYVGAAPDMGCKNEGGLAGRYTFALASGTTRTTYSVTATPKGAQTKDTSCGTLSLNQAGVKGKTGSGTDCW